MKVLTFTNEKGGVGKTFLAVQTAFYAAYEFGFRVVFIDLDAQRNATKILINSKNPKVYLSKTPSNELFEPDCHIALSGLINSRLMLIGSPEDKNDLLNILNKDMEQSAYSFQTAISSLEKICDLLIIDCNPNADIRSNCAISIANTIICPFQLLGESIDGLAGTIERVNNINSMSELYFIPNMVDSSPLQQKKAAELIEFNSEMLLKIKSFKLVTPSSVESTDDKNDQTRDVDSAESEDLVDITTNSASKDIPQITINPANEGSLKSIVITKEAGIYAGIKRRNCFAVAQDESKPIWLTLNNERGWSELRKVLFSILEAVDIERDYCPTKDMEQSLNSLKELYPNYWKLLLRQYWMTNARQILPNLRNVDLINLAQLKEHVPLSLIA